MFQKKKILSFSIQNNIINVTKIKKVEKTL